MKVILYGDSMTEYLHRPPRMLMTHLLERSGEDSWELHNYAIGGTRAELVLYRLNYEYWHGRERMKPVELLEPDLLVFESCAFNNAQDQADGIENFARITREILSCARHKAPQARILTYLTIPPSAQESSYKGNRLLYGAGPEIYVSRYKWRQIYQQVFADTVAGQGVEFLDLRSEVLEQEKFGTSREEFIHSDGVHPNAAGVELISRRLAEMMVAMG